MNKKANASIQHLVIVSVGFTMLLLAFRVFYSGTLSYIFYAWNLFLAAVPLFFSSHLSKRDKLNPGALLLLCGWLLFFPNAPYVVTDLFHYKERWPVPKWYDLLLVLSAAWNGLMLGFISLAQVERFLAGVVNKRRMQALVFVFLLLCGYGIYIGRFMRFNSWDLITDPFSLLGETARHFVNPIEHLVVWKFTLLFALTLAVIYYGIKQLASLDAMKTAA
jgi:uncharacterized membrane protein